MGKIRLPYSYILSNTTRSFYLWTERPYSKYCGLYFDIDGEMVKCLERIETGETLLHTEDHVAGLTNHRTELIETFYFDNDFHYKLSKKHPLKFTFDIRKGNDFSEFGRFYTVEKRGAVVVVSFTNQENNYSYYVAIKTDGDIKILDKFEKADYSYDKQRNSGSERWVYDAFELNAKYFAMTMSSDKEDAIRKAHRAYSREPQINIRRCENKKLERAAHSMDKLISDQGISAGYPWFFQVWSRDELISLKYLIDQEEFDSVKNIFSKYFNDKYVEGFPAILPDTGLPSADATGWLFVRFYDFVAATKHKNVFGDYFDELEAQEIVVFLEVLHAQLRERMKDGLVYSSKNETWMDTSFNDEGREGFCIEIQALMLRASQILYEFTGRKEYQDIEKELKKHVKKKFFRKGNLIDHISPDGTEKNTMRPNVFIANYVYPQLLSKSQWEKVFDSHLESLWLKWGGLSSIDVKSDLFISEHTGETNESYHRGDSWYYINCMAGICMHKLHSKKYKQKINKIIQACQEDLEEGVVGSISEVSSASHRSSFGCLSQSWSLAMYIELLAARNP